VRYLKSRKDIEITTFRHLMEVYGVQKESISRKELEEIAESVVKSGTIQGDENFSAAEALAGLAEAIADFREKGLLPKKMIAVHPLGPVEMPASKPQVARVTFPEACGLAGLAADRIRESGLLPSALAVRGSRVGTGSLFALFCAVYLDMISKNPKLEYDVPAFDPYPRTNEDAIVRAVQELKSWPVHRPDLDMEKIVELTRLQLWTLKPAHRKNVE
jgi:hypothetical protein